MPIEDHIKEAMIVQVEDFMAKLFELANFDPETVNSNSPYMSEVKLARDQILT